MGAKVKKDSWKPKKTWFDVTVTRKLLDDFKEHPELLDDAEREAVDNFKQMRNRQFERDKEVSARIEKDCPILCSGRDSTIIASAGWTDPLEEFAYKMEALNLKYAKYGIKVTAEQTKSKYGTYRFYEAISCKPSRFFRIIGWPGNALHSWLQSVDYGAKTVVDKDEHVTQEWEEVRKEDYDAGRDHHGRKIDLKDKEHRYRIVDSISKDEDGKLKTTARYFVSYDLHHGRQTHIEFTKHPILRKLRDLIWRANMWLGQLEPEPSRKVRVMRRSFELEVERLIREAEHKCTHYCEECGSQIVVGDDDSSRCRTLGWVAYLCERCACADGSTYVKEGKHFREGKQLSAKEVKELRNGW